jgi:hypothetical protein
LKPALQALILCWISAAFMACGGSGSSSADSAVDAAGGVCGTHADPGILKITGRTPAIGASVLNQNIVHGFVVENAPAIFTSFTLRYSDPHTAGNSTPFEPTFQATVSGSNLIYQMTINAWSRAPGHVELVASGGYDTSKGCSWVFPSPLFSYDVTPMLDAGATEVPGDPDGGGGVAVDATDLGAFAVDASID